MPKIFRHGRKFFLFFYRSNLLSFSENNVNTYFVIFFNVAQSGYNKIVKPQSNDLSLFLHKKPSGPSAQELRNGAERDAAF